MAIDPVLHGIMRLSPSPLNRLVAFADDVAAYLHRLLEMVCWLAALLSDAALAIGVGLPPATMLVIPLWPDDLERARAELVGWIPQMTATALADRFVHLGVEGPGARKPVASAGCQVCRARRDGASGDGELLWAGGHFYGPCFLHFALHCLFRPPAGLCGAS